MSIKINKNGKEYDLGMMPIHYPADRVYLDGDITKTLDWIEVNPISKSTEKEFCQELFLQLSAINRKGFVKSGWYGHYYCTGECLIDSVGNLVVIIHPSTNTDYFFVIRSNKIFKYSGTEY